MNKCKKSQRGKDSITGRKNQSKTKDLQADDKGKIEM